MGKRLFATKTNTLKEKGITFSNNGRHNESAFKQINDKIDTASKLHDLQLAATTLAKDLGLTYEKAASDDEGAAKILKSKLKQFYEVWKDDKIEANIKEEYLFCFYQGTERGKSDQDNKIIEAGNDRGLSAYFEGDLKGEKTTIKTGKRGSGGILQDYVEETAQTWRKKKQELKKEAKKELEMLEKVCKKVIDYENWFEKYGQDDYLKNLDKKKLAKLKTQAKNKWDEYEKYFGNEELKKYLDEGYSVFYEKAKERKEKIDGFKVSAQK